MDNTRAHIAKIISITPEWPNAVVAKRSDGKEFYLTYSENHEKFAILSFKDRLSSTGRPIKVFSKQFIARFDLAHFSVPEPTQVYEIDVKSKSIVRV